MIYLIDSHVLIWLSEDSPKLGPQTRRRIQAQEDEVFVSYFSLYELSIKAAAGKYPFDLSVLDDLPRMGLQLLMPETDDLWDYRIFNPLNKDPFDNMLLAVAQHHKCTFVTADHAILATAIPGVALLDARL